MTTPLSDAHRRVNIHVPRAFSKEARLQLKALRNTAHAGSATAGPTATVSVSPSSLCNYGMHNNIWAEGVEELRRQINRGVPIPVIQNSRFVR
jgi:hypothetical protein